MHQEFPARLSHLPHIEGMRAVAILLVVLAHARVPYLSGGYVGVDVFFVISGYLITALLTIERFNSGRIGLLEFYARRFRRLLPALLLMLLFTGLIATVVVSPFEQPREASAAASAALWISNFYFAFSNLDYFAPAAGGSLFLHTWSLGVEEQFYLLWPTLILLAAGLHGRSGTAVRRLFLVMGLVAILSLIASLWLSATKPLLAFYMMPTRGWQFAAGALVWLIQIRHPAILERHASGAGWVGLAMIGLASVVLDDHTNYPGAWSLVPTVGASLLVASGVGASSSLVIRLLSARPLQSIGRVSYSWYLWHWPVLLLGTQMLGDDTLVQRLLLALAALALAALTHHLVETPVRKIKQLVAAPGRAVLSATALLVLANALSIRWHNSVAAWLESPSIERYSAAKQDVPSIYGMGCDDWYFSSKLRVCGFGNQQPKLKAVVMGDSIGLQWFPAIAGVFDTPDWTLYVMTKSGCPMVDEPVFYQRLGRRYTECEDWRAQAVKAIQTIEPDILILGSSAFYEFDPARWVEGTSHFLAEVAPASRSVHLVRATPALPFDGPGCLARPPGLAFGPMEPAPCEAPSLDLNNSAVWEALLQASRAFDNVHAIDLNDLVCPDQRCQAEREGIVVFRDSMHLTATFAKSLQSEFGARIPGLAGSVPQQH